MNKKKSFKDIEQIIRNAAEANEPAFDKESWKKMELLLDKENGKQKLFFWLFGIAFLVGLLLGIPYIYQKTGKSNNTGQSNEHIANLKNNQPAAEKSIISASVKNSTDEQSSQPLQKDNDNKEKTASISAITESQINISKSPQNLSAETSNDKSDLNSEKKNTALSVFLKGKGVNSKTTVQTKSSNTIKTKKQYDEIVYKKKNNKEYNTYGNIKIKVKAPALENNSESVFNEVEPYKKENVAGEKPILPGNQITANEKVNKADDKKKDEIQDSMNVITTTSGINSNVKKRNILSKIYLLGAIGTETSSTKLLSFSNTTISPRYGFGIGYQILKKVSVQAGFYAGAKKYIAGPGDYKIKAGSYLSYQQISKIDANCMVYEIPVSFQYNWHMKPTTSYYVAAGLSSYLMKKESYDISFERNNIYYSYPYHYTKNTHLFAALSLSAGFEKRLNNKFYVQVAPVINIPLGGVGEGSVKLFTSSLNIGIKYFPFKK